VTTTDMTIVNAAQLLAAHLAHHQLPELASLTMRRSEITAQVQTHTVPKVAAELLAWADTLSTVTSTAWRTLDGQSVHLSITSTLTGPAGAVALEVYGGTGDNPVHFADLSPGEYRDVSLGQLRTWATSSSDTTAGGAA
jgi:hypothetical protein